MERNLGAAVLTLAVIAVVLALGANPAAAEGAMAIGKCGAWGWSSQTSVMAARDEAMADCARDGHTNCRVVATTHGGCVAVATDSSATCARADWATEATKDEAQSGSLVDCRERDGKSCAVLALKCDAE